MVDEKKAGIEIRRNTVTLHATDIPMVFYAQENISLKMGQSGKNASIPVSGFGASRAEALAAVEIQFENLKKVLMAAK